MELIPTPPPEPTAGIAQYAIALAIAGLYAAYAYLFKRQDSARDKLRSESKSDSDVLWEEIGKLREAITNHQQQAARDRADILSNMVTRGELDRQVARLETAILSLRINLTK